MNKALLILIEKDITVTHCLLFILQPIYLHNLSLLMSSQPITSHVYKWPLNLLTNQIDHQGFEIFNWLKLSLDCKDDFRTGCPNISHQHQSFSGLQSPRWSFSIKVYYSCEEIAQVNLSKTHPPLLKSPNGWHAIICISSLLVTLSNQDNTTTRRHNLFQGNRWQKHDEG